MRAAGGGPQHYDYVADRHRHLRHRAWPPRGRAGAAPAPENGVAVGGDPPHRARTLLRSRAGAVRAWGPRGTAGPSNNVTARCGSSGCHPGRREDRIAGPYRHRGAGAERLDVCGGAAPGPSPTWRDRRGRSSLREPPLGCPETQSSPGPAADRRIADSCHRSPACSRYRGLSVWESIGAGAEVQRSPGALSAPWDPTLDGPGVWVVTRACCGSPDHRLGPLQPGELTLPRRAWIRMGPGPMCSDRRGHRQRYGSVTVCPGRGAVHDGRLEGPPGTAAGPPTGQPL
jgi:hypothetical protein